MRTFKITLLICVLLSGRSNGARRERNEKKKAPDSAGKEYDDLLDEGNMLPFFPEKVNNVTVKVGQSAELRCKVDNLNSYKVAWVRVDTQTILSIHNNVITRNPRISLSRPSADQWYIHIQRVKENDRGWYMCQINTDPMVHRSGYLEVVVPPRIEKSQHGTDLVVREGENLTLWCNSRGHPRPQIVWRRDDGENILVDGEKASMVESDNLRLHKISRLHMGDYLCVASNGIQPSASMKFRVMVQFPPMFWIPSQLEGAYVGQDVTLECHSEAHPKSINYWVKDDGEMLISNDKYETLIVDSGYKVYMKLRIRNVSAADFAEYKCVAKNSLGGSDGAITLYEVKPPTTTTSTTSTTTTVRRTTALHTRRGGERKGNKRQHRRRKKQDQEDSHISNKENFFKKLSFGGSNSQNGSSGSLVVAASFAYVVVTVIVLHLC